METGSTPPDGPFDDLMRRTRRWPCPGESEGLPPLDDPLTADPAVLEFYGLPALPDRGTLPRQYRFWSRMYAGRPRFVVPRFDPSDSFTRW